MSHEPGLSWLGTSENSAPRPIDVLGRPSAVGPSESPPGRLRRLRGSVGEMKSQFLAERRREYEYECRFDSSSIAVTYLRQALHNRHGLQDRGVGGLDLGCVCHRPEDETRDSAVLNKKGCGRR